MFEKNLFSNEPIDFKQYNSNARASIDLVRRNVTQYNLWHVMQGFQTNFQE